jgi:hypothetical protein
MFARPSPTSLLFAMSLPALAGALQAQTYHWSGRDELWSRQRSIGVYDAGRNRMVVLGGIVSIGHQIIEWDGHDWLEREPATPAAASLSQVGQAAAYDAARREVVAYMNGATWTWDGHDLEQKVTSQRPAGFNQMSMAYDPVRESCVVFGGTTTSPPYYAATTHEWDGSDWVTRAAATVPPPRGGASLAWDAVRQEVLMFGGQDLAGYRNDTWSWNGNDWTLMQPSVSPPATSWQTMALDPIRQVIVMVVVDTPTMQTWEWDGSDWSRITTVHAPPLHSESSMAFDGSRIVLAFGGSWEDPTTTWTYDGVDWTLVDERPRFQLMQVADDHDRGRLVAYDRNTETQQHTWEWDGIRWRPRFSATDPGELTGPAFAYDPNLQRTLLLGGSTPSFVEVDDQWEWDGASWTKTNPTPRPGARWQAAMAFDEQNSRMVLFGGADANVLDDTWIWDGVAWTQVFPATVPPARRLAGLVYDSARQRCVLVGGTGSGSLPGSYLQDAWEWDGSDWSQIPSVPAQGISLRFHYYDPAVGVVAAGYSNGVYESWAWDGVSWTYLGTVPKPQVMAYDRSRGYAMSIGRWLTSIGRVAPSTDPSVTEYATGCAGFAGVPTLAERGLPFVGTDEFLFELASAAPSSVAAFLLGETSASVPVGGCTLAVGTPNAPAFAVSNAHGFAELAFPIPYSTALIGFAFSAQGFVLDQQGAGLGVFSSTAGLRVVVGS